MNIGVIGKGNIGSTLGELLTKAGHDISFGHRSEAGSVELAVSFGDVVIFAGYFSGWPEFVQHNAAALSGKTVIDAANPYGERDGAIVDEVAQGGVGAGGFVARLLPSSHVAKAFNTLYWVDLRDRAGQDIGLPLSADEPAASVAAQLVRDAGYEPVVLPLSSASMQDPNGPLYGSPLTALELRQIAERSGAKDTNGAHG